MTGVNHVLRPGDFAKYFAQYTSRGGDPKEAAHSYYRDHHGHVANYDVEPEYAQPRQVRIDHLKGKAASAALTATAADHVTTDPHASQRNFVQAGNGFHSRVNTGKVPSPSGNGPHHGFYFGDQPNGGKLLVGDHTVIRF